MENENRKENGRIYILGFGKLSCPLAQLLIVAKLPTKLPF
jgi:hypothetical protein